MAQMDMLFLTSGTSWLGLALSTLGHSGPGRPNALRTTMYMRKVCPLALPCPEFLAFRVARDALLRSY